MARSKDGRALTSLSTINLVHDEVIAQEKARRADELLRRTVSNIPMGVSVYKLEKDELVTLYKSDFIDTVFGGENETLESYRAAVLRFLKENSFGEGSTEGSRVTRLSRANGAELWVNTHYRIVNDDGSVTIYIAVSDVTEQIENRRREEAREETYRMVLNDTGTMVFDYNPAADRFKFLIHSGGSEL